MCEGENHHLLDGSCSTVCRKKVPCGSRLVNESRVSQALRVLKMSVAPKAFICLYFLVPAPRNLERLRRMSNLSGSSVAASLTHHC